MTTDPHALQKVEGGKVAKPPQTLGELLQSVEFKAKIAAALPRHMTADRMIRVALTAAMRNPAIGTCTPNSVIKCLLDCSAFGLEPDGRNAHLIPYGKECTLIFDYKGLISLARRSGQVSYIHCDVVYHGDEWSYSYGTKAHLRHVPNLENRTDKVRAVYSFVRLKDGSEDFLVMGPDEIEKVRKSSRAKSGPWFDWWGEMAKKTVFRRHSKWLPLSPEVMDAIERDDDLIDTPGRNVERAVISLESLTPSEDENRGHDDSAGELKRITPDDLKGALKPPSVLEDEDSFPDFEVPWCKVRGVIHHREREGGNFTWVPWETPQGVA